MPEWRQTDNSTAATHRIPDAKSAVADGSTKRPFNDDYLAIMRHFGMKPRTTTVRAKEQNGDVEAANGVLKRALEQSLLLRGSRVCDHVAYYNGDRPHMALEGDAPVGRAIEGPDEGDVIALPRVGGGHHRYARAARFDGRTNISPPQLARHPRSALAQLN